MLKRLGRATFIFLIGVGIIIYSHFGNNDAHATGIGGYITFGSGDSEFNEEYNGGFWNDLESSGDAKFFGFGFIFDTAVAKDRVFNYRLQIGFEDVEYDIDSVYNKTTGIDLSPAITDYELEIDRFVFDNTFGFGIVRKENFRLWIGPQIRIGYMSGKGAYSIFGNRRELDFDGVVFGFAPVIGANLNFKNNFTLGIDLGYRFNGFLGSLQKSGSGFSDGGDYDGTEDTIFINFAFIYRINDNF